VTLTIREDGREIGDTFRVFANVSPAGLPLAAIDTGKAITGAKAIQFFPLGASVPTSMPGVWGRGPWGRGSWGVSDPNRGHKIASPLLYHGRFQFVVYAFDQVGNAHVGTPQVFRRTINSGPQPVHKLRHSSTVNGRPVFAFTPPAQFTEDV